MVLTLKRWKSRTPPGIEASVSHKNPFTKSTGLSRKGSPFGVSDKRQGAAGWSSPVARQAHNLKVVGSNPTPATNSVIRRSHKHFKSDVSDTVSNGDFGGSDRGLFLGVLSFSVVASYE